MDILLSFGTADTLSRSICPSSLISFHVSRRHTIEYLGDKNVGTFDASILTLLDNGESADLNEACYIYSQRISWI